MNQNPVGGNMINMLAVNLEIINNLRPWSWKFLNDSFRLTAVKKETFAFDQFSRRDKVLSIDRPERVIVRATDRLFLVFDHKIDRFLGDVREGSRNDVPHAVLDVDVFVDVRQRRPADDAHFRQFQPDVKRVIIRRVEFA